MRCGGGFGFLREGGVGGGDDPVEFGQDVVFVVEGAVGEDVDFAAGEDEHAGLCGLLWRRRGWP